MVQSLEGLPGAREQFGLPARGEISDIEGLRAGVRERVLDRDEAVEVDVAGMDGDADDEIRDQLDPREAEVLHGEHGGVIVGIEIADCGHSLG